MTSKSTAPTFEDRYRTPQGQQGLAAALLGMDVVDLLNECAEAADVAGINKKGIADLMGVSQARVSQVLNGDGNITIAALAKFLHAMGFEARVGAHALYDTRDSDGVTFQTEDEALVASVRDEVVRCGKVLSYTLQASAAQPHELDLLDGEPRKRRQLSL